ncbi:hypothetical protein GC176_12195 [bacterium]|nr:hypothetical protein [bacterium]
MLSRLSLTRCSHSSRGGFLAPAALIALVVVLGAAALVIDRLWLDNAQVELTTAAEAAALAGAGRLATDDLLRTGVDHEVVVSEARSAALRIAQENRIAGQAVVLDPSPAGDIRFGRLVQDDAGRTVFLETNQQPTSVVVNAEHSHDRNNPVVRFFDGWLSQQGADVAARAEATVDNHIVGFRPLNELPIPVLPIAILRASSGSTQTPTWQRDIERRAGSDRFGIDPLTGAVTNQSDGIPEIVLRDSGVTPQGSSSSTTQPVASASNPQIPDSQISDPPISNQQTTASASGTTSPPLPTERNVYAFALNPKSSATQVARQFRSGWTVADFPSGVDILRIDRGPLSFAALDSLGGAVADSITQIVGQQRIVFLFDSVTIGRGTDRVTCVATVAGRVMSFHPNVAGGCEIVFQPTVLTTRTAVLSRETVTQGPLDRFVNRYTYKLQLTQ